MQFLSIIILIILSLNLSGQQLSNCGKDNNSKINNDEARFLNSYLTDTKNVFDFSGKKIAFITGSSGSKVGTKNEYFREVKKRDLNNSKIATSFIILTDDEKLQSGGYDAIITYWVKILIDNKRKKKIVNKLKISHQLEVRG